MALAQHPPSGRFARSSPADLAGRKTFASALLTASAREIEGWENEGGHLRARPDTVHRSRDEQLGGHAPRRG